MSGRTHSYSVKVDWTGNLGQGTLDYTSYSRDHQIQIEGRPILLGSSDSAFRGNPSRYNPEDLLVSSLSACHMLWYLHLCAEAGIVVTSYTDHASGTMMETAATGGHFTEVVLRPSVVITDGSKIDLAKAIHDQAHHLCFIANSVKFPVRYEPKIGSS